MLDFFKKTMFAGIGLAFLTKDKVIELSKEFMKVEKLSEKEGKELFKELSKKSAEARKELKGHVETIVQDSMKKMNFVSKEGKQLFQEISKKSGEVKKDVTIHMEKMLRDTIKKMNLVTKDDLAKLEKKLKPQVKQQGKTPAKKNTKAAPGRKAKKQES